MNQHIIAAVSPDDGLRPATPHASLRHSLARRFRAVLAAAVAAAFPSMPQGAELPALVAGHTDVGVNYEDDAWDLHVHAEETGMEYAPDAVWIKVPASSRTSAPSGTAYSFLGTPGNALWVLPAVQHPNMPFLGFGTEEMASGIFSNNVVQLAFKGVEGPGDFMAYQSDMFGQPVVWFNSRDGAGAGDVQPLPAGAHTHVNWVFTAPGKYRVKFQASGVLAATGQATSSDVAEYLFDVGDMPLVTLARESGRDHLHLEWLSETNTQYQIQQRANADTGRWENLGAPVAGTGAMMEEHIEPGQAAQFFRVLVDYSGGSAPGITARLFIADATNAALSMIDLETGVVSPGLFPLSSRAVLGSTPSSRYCLAVELDADKAELFDSGVYVEDHGDHWHYYKENARRMSVPLAGDNPVHTVSRANWLTLHWDLTGRVDIFDEAQLAVLGDAYRPATIASGAQHGSAVPVGTNQFFAISKPNPLYPVPVPNPLPVGVDIWDLNTSNRVYTATGYSNMHGEAGNGKTAAFGFTQGVLLLWQTETGWTHFMVTNPPSMPAGYRIGDLRGHDSLDHYFGLAFLSETAGDMFVINATNLTMELLPLPGGSFAVAYELSPDGNTFAVVLANGDLVKLDARTAKVAATRQGLIAPSVNHSNHGQFHPGIAMGLGRVYVTDPAGQRVLELDLETLATMRAFPLAGSPTKVSMHGVLEPPSRN